MKDQKGCEWQILGTGSFIRQDKLLSKYGVIPSKTFSSAMHLGYIDPSGVLELLEVNEHYGQGKYYMKFFEDASRVPGSPFKASYYFILFYQWSGSTGVTTEYANWGLYRYDCPAATDPVEPVEPVDPDIPPTPGPTTIYQKICMDGSVLLWSDDEPEPECEAHGHKPPKKASIGPVLIFLGLGALVTVLIAKIGGKKGGAA